MGERLSKEEVLEYVSFMNETIADRPLSSFITSDRARQILPSIVLTLVEDFARSKCDTSDEAATNCGRLVTSGIMMGIFLAETNQASISGAERELN